MCTCFLLHNPIALRKAKIVHNFGLSEYKRAKLTIHVLIIIELKLLPKVTLYWSVTFLQCGLASAV